MGKKNSEKLKEITLSGFVFLCVGLIIAIWINAFVEKDVETPYFYRGVPEFSEAMDATETAYAEQFRSENVTPSPGSPPALTAPTPTITPSACPAFSYGYGLER